MEIVYLILQFITDKIEALSEIIGSKNPILNAIWDHRIRMFLLIATIIIDLIVFCKWYRSEGIKRGTYFSTLFTITEVLAIIIFWYVPQWLYQYITSKVTAEFIRWVLLYGCSMFTYIGTRKYSGRRGLYTYLAHISTFLLGWLFGHWIGILWLSLPLLTAFYFTLYQIAVAIVPAANPDARFLRFDEFKTFGKDLLDFLKQIFKSNPKLLYQNLVKIVSVFFETIPKIGGEKWKRFWVLVWYLWGFQYPLLVVTDSTGRKVETRISGSPFKRFGTPGLIWASSHHAVGITTGIQFARVDGPGAVFTGPYERSMEVVDLRTQLRSSEIEAVTKDGNPFKAILFSAFAIDRAEWSIAEHHRLQKANSTLKDGKELDCRIGSYHFSRARVQAALSTTGVMASNPNSDTLAVHWDDWVLSRLEEAARLILSHRNLDELWHPHLDGEGKSALTEIGDEIKSLMAPRLRESGIQLFTSRVVNFIFPDDHPVAKQQIASWSTAWEKRAAQTIAEGEAEAERLQREARAYAQSFLLTLVSEELQKARLVHPDLPKNVVALRIIGAFEELLKRQPEKVGDDLRTRFSTIKRSLFSGHS